MSNTNGATTPQSTDLVKATTDPTPRRTLARAGDIEGLNVFSSLANFETGQRMAKALSMSTLVPSQYRGANGIANCMLALDMAARINATAFAVIQALDIIGGRPSFKAAFLIATVNSSGKFSPLRFRWEEHGEPVSPARVSKRGETFGCRAVAKDMATDEACIGTLITWAMVDGEGWSKKDGSKWATMAEQMFQYRAAAFWTRIYAPEISQGMQTREEVADFTGYTVTEIPDGPPQGSTRALEESLLTTGEPAEPKPDAPPSTPDPVAHDEDGVVQDAEVVS